MPIVANEDQWHSLVVNLCTTVGDSVVSTAIPDPKHVNPHGFASPDSKQDSSSKCCMPRPVLDRDKGEGGVPLPREALVA